MIFSHNTILNGPTHLPNSQPIILRETCIKCAFSECAAICVEATFCSCTTHSSLNIEINYAKTRHYNVIWFTSYIAIIPSQTILLYCIVIIHLHTHLDHQLRHPDSNKQINIVLAHKHAYICFIVHWIHWKSNISITKWDKDKQLAPF